MANEYHKHWIGYVLIALSGALLLAGLILGIFATYHAGLLTPQLYNLLATLIVAVILGTVLSLWFWHWPVLIYGTSNVAITNWRSLFSDSTVEAEWIDIVDVTTAKPNILYQLFDMSVLTVETAGTQPNLTFAFLPHGDMIAEQMQKTTAELKAERDAINATK